MGIKMKTVQQSYIFREWMHGVDISLADIENRYIKNGFKIVDDVSPPDEKEPDRTDLCDSSGLPGTPCDKDNCNSGCL